MRIRLKVIGFGAASLLLGTAGFAAWLFLAPRVPPHIILISVDTLRADRLGAYGYEVATPNLDALAKRGTLFVNATVPFPRTTPAMASLFTGLRPEHHGSREVQQPVKRGQRLAEIFKAGGYQTIGVTSNPACGQRVGLARGFDIFSDQVTSAKVNEKVAEALDRIDRNLPVLVWAHYLDPHWPYHPGRWWLRQPPTGLCRRLETLPPGLVFGNAVGRAQAALADCSLRYDGEVAAVDARVGELLGSLSEVLGENRIVLFTSDHGENLGEDGLFYEHGPSVHGASLEVPLIVAGTGIGAGAIDRELIRIEDLMPTLLRLAGIDRQHWPTMDGVDMSARFRETFFSRRSSDRARSIVTLAEGGSALQAHFFNRVVSGTREGLGCTNGPRFSLCRKPDGPAALYDHIADPLLTTDLSAQHPDTIAALENTAALWPVERARQRAIRTTRFKLVARPRREGGYALSLYDLATDPRETRDARSEHPEIFRRLKERLELWSASLPDLDISQRSAADIEALRALGYIEGSE